MNANIATLPAPALALLSAAAIKRRCLDTAVARQHNALESLQRALANLTKALDMQPNLYFPEPDDVAQFQRQCLYAVRRSRALLAADARDVAEYLAAVVQASGKAVAA